MNEVAEFLRECHTFYIATVEGNQPRVRPFGAMDVFEGKLYIVTNNQKKVYAQIEKNPFIELCAMNAKREWLRLSAECVKDSRVEAQAHMLEANPSIQRLYKAGDGLMEVFYLKNAEATISSYTAAPRVFHF